MADEFSAALARERKAEWVPGDLEFKSLEKELKINWLTEQAAAVVGVVWPQIGTKKTLKREFQGRKLVAGLGFEPRTFRL